MLGNLFGQRKTHGVSQPQTPIVSGQTPVSSPSMANPMAQAPGVASQSDDVVGSSMKPDLRQDLSILTHLDSRTATVLHQAEQEARRTKQAMIEPDHILLGLLFDGDIFQMLSGMGVDATKIANALQAKTKEGTFTGQPTLSSNAKEIFEKAYQGAKHRSTEFITPEDVLLTLFSDSSIAGFLQSSGVTKDKIEEKLAKSADFVTGKKSVLDQFGVDLTREAKEGKLDPVVGRDKEVERLVHILLRRTKNNPIIIGEAGTGKTALVEGLAEAIANGSAPKDLLNKRIIQLDISSLVAGASHRGEFEERLRSVIKETQIAAGQIILFIDEIHTLIGTGDTEGALDASNIIKPFLARGQLQIIGTTTTAEYKRYFEKDKAFERRFQPILVEEPSEEVAVQMLEVLKPKYEKFHSVVLTDEALKAAVHLSKKYIGERYLPDKAVDLLDEAAAAVRLMVTSGQSQDNTVKKADIEKVVSAWTGIPITKLTEDESEKLLHMEDLIHKRLIGQQLAVEAVAEAVRRGRIGLAAANRPIASFIFLGPTGTGKTELAKTLAEILFGKEDAMIRLDMSEYMEKHEVAKLIGAPPGYVGYEEGGQLTEAVRRKPYSVVLLDEIEKAHPDVFNILLQLLEDGRLTDNKGNTVSFKNTIIIATSNIGSALIQEKLDGNKATTPEEMQKKSEELSQILLGELRKFFKPELLNRFDELVMFEPLRQADMITIAKLRMEGTKKSLMEQNVSISVTDKALAQLAKEGYDPLYGARPLRRLIQSSIENPIAMLLIQKAFVPGDTVVIDYDEQKEEFTFAKAQPTQPVVAEQPVATAAQQPTVQAPVAPSPVVQPQPTYPTPPQPAASSPSFSQFTWSRPATASPTQSNGMQMQPKV